MDVKSCGGILLKFHGLAMFGSQKKKCKRFVSPLSKVCVCVCVPLTLKKQVRLNFSVQVPVVSYFCFQYIAIGSMYVLYLSTCTSQMQVNTPIPWIRHGYFYRPYVHTITTRAVFVVSQIENNRCSLEI